MKRFFADLFRRLLGRPTRREQIMARLTDETVEERRARMEKYLDIDVEDNQCSDCGRLIQYEGRCTSCLALEIDYDDDADKETDEQHRARMEKYFRVLRGY